MKHRLSSALVVFALSLTLFVSPTFAATTLVVDGSDGGCSDVTGAPYCTIQAAIDAASSGDTITVAAGTYVEQLFITKNVTLDGGGVATVQAPAVLVNDAGGMKNIVTIDGAAVAAEITGFTITGPGPSGCGSINSGLMVRGGADLNLHDNAISDIRDEPLSGCQNGQGIWVGRTAMATTGTATITNNVFSGYQKGGIVVDNVGSSAVITGNTVTGVGPTAAIAMNGIQVSRGATATVTGNTVSGHDYTGAEGAVGILLYQAGSPTNIGPNTSVTSNELGIWTDMQHTVGTMNLSGVTGNVRDAVADFTGWSAPVGTYADDDFSTGIVDADGGDIVDIAGASLHVLGWDAFATIQAAVDAASDGDTVNVAAGTYDEQVVIDGISLTLDGAGDTTVIQPADPAKLISIYTLGTQDAALFNGMKLASIVNVMNVGAAGVTIKDLKINGVDVDALPAGANYVVGLSYGETGGQISNVSVLNMNSVPAATRTYGMWLDAVGGTALDVEVLNSTIQFFNRNGLNARGNSLTVNIHDSLVDGGGPVAGQVLNGILLINGAGGQIVNNEIHDNSYVGDTWKGSGVLLYQTIPGILISENEIYATDDAIIINATNSATISNNDLHDNYKGVQLEAGAATNLILNNTFTNNDYGIFVNDTAGVGNEAHDNEITASAEYGIWNQTASTFDAKNNWWGHISGPYDDSTVLVDACTLPLENPGGLGDPVSGCVDYDPWSGQAPGQPTLLSPDHNSLLTDYTPTLDWTDVSGAAYYQIEITPNNPIPTALGKITDSEWTPLKDLAPKTRFFWRVRAFNSFDVAGPWSATWSFRTALLAPTLQLPGEGEVLTDRTPTFTWNAVGGAQNYTLQVSRNPGFTVLVTNETVSGVTYTQPTNLASNKTYYWRVRANNTQFGPSAWSTVRTFREAALPLSAPILQKPNNNGTITDQTPGFNWQDSSGATGYTIQISRFANFSKLVKTANVTNSQYVIPNTLQKNVTFYWRVRANGPEGPSGWSEVWSFSIK